MNSGFVRKVYKGAETWAQTGHRSGGQVQLDLVHAALCVCVSHFTCIHELRNAMSGTRLKSSGY